ncbi:hypothetical protein L6164_031583 [Bauhinia variegata]|uniref:Uncharacterized protein n=1 Tax=Bauhinia variegata TaxID=167791 RepID=A0ACB9LG27_BAUVA|nr:hypothetical protein L6164_031583 [Bauhinia variegata]
MEAQHHFNKGRSENAKGNKEGSENAKRDYIPEKLASDGNEFVQLLWTQRFEHKYVTTVLHKPLHRER